MTTLLRCPGCGLPLTPDVGDLVRRPLHGVLACLAHGFDCLDPTPRLYRRAANGRLSPLSLAATPVARTRSNRKLGLEP
ncbi:hypothetical protein [Myxococcus sp. CA040A]|uniref:hypothetical protein n=1 Tax=Myxococcus sp. CA040A TaxID=2741738 RepID=UPI00157A62D6|nr:hypothetical protein [Myxococcus sp. CA040A]NTX07023.1 hypothetical protein [Myxococcus sp. CA040A]